MPIAKSKSYRFRNWMRQYGVCLWFFVCLYMARATFSIQYTYEECWPLLLVPPNSSDIEQRNSTVLAWFDWFVMNFRLESGLYQPWDEYFEGSSYIIYVLWLFLRLHNMSVFRIIYYQAHAFLITTPPNPEADIAELENDQDYPALAHHQFNGAICPKSKKKVGAYRPPVHCLCVRLVSRGDKAAQALIYNSIHAALMLFSRICNCEHLKIHIVTQTRFVSDKTKKSWMRQGATEVEEFFVPQTYKTPKGTLYKARNICYWQEMGGVGADCDETRSWILSLDEEAVVLRSLVSSFVKDVLLSEDEPKIGFALSPAIIDVKTGSISFWTKFLEARFMAWHYSSLRSECWGMHPGTLFFHGGAFFVRASVDRAVGNDWGWKSSVAEDFATGIVATDKGITFKYLTGWFVEGTSENIYGYINHRARVLRGQLYNMCYTRMSRRQKMEVWSHLAPAVIFPFIHLLLVTLWFIKRVYLPPSSPRATLQDYLVAFSLAVQGSCYAFGASFMEMTNVEVIVCTLVSPIAGFVLAPITDSLVVLKALQCIFNEWKSGSTTFPITAKPTRQKVAIKNGKMDINNLEALFWLVVILYIYYVPAIVSFILRI